MITINIKVWRARAGQTAHRTGYRNIFDLQEFYGYPRRWHSVTLATGRKDVRILTSPKTVFFVVHRRHVFTVFLAFLSMVTPAYPYHTWQ